MRDTCRVLVTVRKGDHTYMLSFFAGEAHRAYSVLSRWCDTPDLPLDWDDMPGLEQALDAAMDAMTETEEQEAFDEDEEEWL